MGNPSFGNTCLILSPGSMAGSSHRGGAGLLGGNLAQTPLEPGKNSCGSTDVDIDVTF
ncbi:hypothetical protein [Streptomyces sp. YIM 98790]|uniref:hypothetical protein n=1 Tax=Streptomyces sp. YIM 98790 TaxID=2689077 RepID=UPI00140D7090|nr:hypothetical protein [Streptomyces sp. YIM 98790]